MKITKLFFLTMLLSLSLTACQNKAVKAADELIAEIGTISLSSGDAIVAAEEAVEELSKKEQKQLENAKELEDAREEYDKLVKKKDTFKTMVDNSMQSLISENTITNYTFDIDDDGNISIKTWSSSWDGLLNQFARLSTQHWKQSWDNRRDAEEGFAEALTAEYAKTGLGGTIIYEIADASDNNNIWFRFENGICTYDAAD